ncbi:hypothetical protein CHISP_2081 [Chitinispirillum alkaliphilum]|nr:hypothetical protein CHISP_2081 [Chitinispirillum alkaliphilum]
MNTQGNADNRRYKMPKSFAGTQVAGTVCDLKKTIAKGGGCIILDFSNTEFIDSSGIGTLVSLAQDLRGENKRLIIRGLRQALLRIFIETGIDIFFDIENLGRIKPADTDFKDNSVQIRLNISDQTEGDVKVLSLKGMMNHPEGSNLFKKNMLLAMASHQKILIDLENLAYFDSLSIGTVLKLNKLLKETGGGLRMCAPNCIVQDLFSTLNIDSIIPVFDNCDKALLDWKNR